MDANLKNVQVIKRNNPLKNVTKNQIQETDM